MGTRKNGLTADDWHDTLTAMRPAYNALSRICMSHKRRTTQHLVAENAMQSMVDLAKLHGRHGHYYFITPPHSTHNNA